MKEGHPWRWALTISSSWTHGFCGNKVSHQSGKGWNLGPLTTVPAPGQMCPEHRLQRNHKGLKVTAYMHSLGKQLMNNKKQKGQNPAATSEVLRAKAGSCTWSLHPAPPRGWADHPSYTSGPTHRAAPTLTPCKGPARTTPPHQRASKGTCFLFSLTCAAARIPVKLCLNSSSGLLPTSTD